MTAIIFKQMCFQDKHFIKIFFIQKNKNKKTVPNVEKREAKCWEFKSEREGKFHRSVFHHLEHIKIFSFEKHHTPLNYIIALKPFVASQIVINLRIIVFAV